MLMPSRSLLMAMATTMAVGLPVDPDLRCASDWRSPTILILYDTQTNHTKQLGLAIQQGCRTADPTPANCLASDIATPHTPGYPAARSAHAIAIGSPVLYANPSAGMLQWISDGLGPGWANRTFAGVPGCVFATGGGINQGLDSTLNALARGLVNFGFRLVTPDVASSGFYSSLGPTAVTGTLPWTGETVDEAFLEVGRAMGRKLVAEAQKEWQFRCG
eukprot:TRINITY_DN12869_c0_g1_i3.p1 TRINITY_DN12869_c0_g1~~TRINITY_DN12869_c0_g1_i3.p1  ORF type:complete len:218 (+),score=38.08 TRINITY_DN12869_c0_g1_i3:56-709(+)